MGEGWRLQNREHVRAGTPNVQRRHLPSSAALQLQQQQPRSRTAPHPAEEVEALAVRVALVHRAVKHAVAGLDEEAAQAAGPGSELEEARSVGLVGGYSRQKRCVSHVAQVSSCSNRVVQLVCMQLRSPRSSTTLRPML